jgi:uncharacterized protein YndB with AHSA1/START domain
MASTEQKILNAPWMTTGIQTQSASDVILSYRIEAETSRVLYALSMPEYIEAWLQAPDDDTFRFAFDPETREGFRIDLYQGEVRQSSLYSACRVVSSNQVRYVWKTISPNSISDTLVDMHLRSSPGGCILGLKHSGFKDNVESTWCYKMWHRSLECLCKLMSRNRSAIIH